MGCKEFGVAPSGSGKEAVKYPTNQEIEKRENVKYHVTSVAGVVIHFVIQMT